MASIGLVLRRRGRERKRKDKRFENINYLIIQSLVTVDIIGFLDKINQSVSEPVFIVKPEHNLQSGLVNLEKCALIFRNILKFSYLAAGSLVKYYRE